ncbi:MULTISPECIES: GAF and ANTAR domain-containing protein [unclassified Actinomadura]|uniref:GAF and ANTAR domain-containing protein n=1 Tax=unclassified Actinomadura TaxID=2626254 RepID=UPI001356B8CE|nr:GAF and ANTAR domain-containing protein [Actinomadura sp. K4S16]
MTDRLESDSDRFPDSAGHMVELTRSLLDAETVAGVLRRILLAAQILVPDADMASITLRERDGELRTPFHSDQAAIDLDRLQYRLGEGPCLDAADPAGAAFARSGDLAAEPAWPEFGPAAASYGYASVLATALLLPTESDEAVGALNMYSRERGTLDGLACDTALLLATHASLALAAVRTAADGARDRADAENQMVNLRTALDTRTVIGQATGILMARRGLDAAKAFELLSRTSQNLNVRLGSLAEGIVSTPETADDL